MKTIETMKKEYKTPTTEIIAVKLKAALLTISTPTTVAGNAGFNSTISGGHGSARVKERGDWDDEELELW